MIQSRKKIKKTRFKTVDPDANQFLIKYGIRIKQKRKKLNKTLVQMAALLKTDISRLSMIENGKINLTINEIYLLDKQMDEHFEKK